MRINSAERPTLCSMIQHVIICFACSQVRKFASSHVRMFACSHVRMFACSHTRILAYSHIRILAYSHIRIFAYVVNLFRTSGTYPVTLRCPTLLGNDSISPEDKKRVHLAKLLKLTEVQSVTEASLASTSKKGRTTHVFLGCELSTPYSEILLTSPLSN